MAKTRHQTEPTSNRATMAILVAGGLLVAALVVWALTRTVEPSTQSVMTDVSTTAPAPAPAASSPTATADGSIPPGALATSAPTGTVAGQATPPPQPSRDSSAVQRIAVEDLRAKLNRNEVTVIDVRDAASYGGGHIPGSINVPFASVESMLDTIPKDKPIVTYCT
jgi:hypothetical protein